MSNKDYEAAFNTELCARVKMLRQRRGWSIRYTAKMLDVHEDTYGTYEKVSPLPPHLIPKFAAYMGVSISYVLTGQHEKWPPEESS